MSSIQAHQLIYSRVESAYSPSRSAGFQVVYASPELSSAEVSSIERRVKCFEPQDEGVTRRQFFRLESGRAVITHSVPIRADTEITDRNGRRGAFIAHCLVVSAEDFLQVKNNPFYLFDEADRHFVTDPKEMAARFHPERGSDLNKPILVELDKTSSGPSNRWSEQAERLAMIAGYVPKGGQTLLFVGDESAVEDVLRAIFWFALPMTRLRCTFDTYIDQCVTAQGTYWAVGASSRQEGPYLAINAEDTNLGNQPPAGAAGDSSSSYGRWLGEAQRDPGKMSDAPAIQELFEAFEQRRSLNPHLINDRASRTYFALNQAQVVKQVQGPLEAVSTPAVSSEVARSLPTFADQLQDAALSGLLEMAASGSAIPQPAAESIRIWLPQSGKARTLKLADWESLNRLGRDAQDPILILWSSAMLNDQQSAAWALRSMDESQYEQALKLLMQPIEPAWLVKPHSSYLLLKRITLSELSVPQFMQLVQALIDQGEGNELDPLAQNVLTLNWNQLTQLTEIIQRGRASDYFIESVRRRRAELEQKKKGTGPLTIALWVAGALVVLLVLAGMGIVTLYFVLGRESLAAMMPEIGFFAPSDSPIVDATAEGSEPVLWLTETAIAAAATPDPTLGPIIAPTMPLTAEPTLQLTVQLTQEPLSQPTPLPLPSITELTLTTTLNPDNTAGNPVALGFQTTDPFGISFVIQNYQADQPIIVEWKRQSDGLIVGRTELQPGSIQNGRGGALSQPPPEGWQPGDYEVAITYHGQPLKTQGFKVGSLE